MGGLADEGVPEPDRFPGRLAKRDRHLEQHAGNLAWTVIFAEVGDRLDAHEAELHEVFREGARLRDEQQYTI